MAINRHFAQNPTFREDRPHTVALSIWRMVFSLFGAFPLSWLKYVPPVQIIQVIMSVRFCAEPGIWSNRDLGIIFGQPLLWENQQAQRSLKNTNIIVRTGRTNANRA